MYNDFPKLLCPISLRKSIFLEAQCSQGSADVVFLTSPLPKTRPVCQHLGIGSISGMTGPRESREILELGSPGCAIIVSTSLKQIVA